MLSGADLQGLQENHLGDAGSRQLRNRTGQELIVGN